MTDAPSPGTNSTPKRPSRFWTFANSNFGLWLFSGLLVGVVTFGWSEYRDWKRQEADRTRQVSRLRTEIEARVERCYRLIRADWDGPTGVPVERRLRQAGITGPPTSVVVFPEFSDRPLTSLFWEIRKLNPSNTDYYAAAQGVAEQLEVGLWQRSEPGTSKLPADDEYTFHLAMLTILRSEQHREADAAMEQLIRQFPQTTPEEMESYMNEHWPEYSKLMEPIERERAADRARKEKLLREKDETKQPENVRPAG